jgi:hypothetical protein
MQITAADRPTKELNLLKRNESKNPQKHSTKNKFARNYWLRALKRPKRHHQFDAHCLQLVEHTLGVGPALGVEVPVALRGPVLQVKPHGENARWDEMIVQERIIQWVKHVHDRL